MCLGVLNLQTPLFVTQPPSPTNFLGLQCPTTAFDGQQVFDRDLFYQKFLFYILYVFEDEKMWESSKKNGFLSIFRNATKHLKNLFSNIYFGSN